MKRQYVILIICLGLVAIFVRIQGCPSTKDRDQNFAAVLKNKARDVQTRRADSLSWMSAENDERLHYFDSVMTMADASARIDFQDGPELDLAADTMVVIQPPLEKQSELRINIKRGTATLHLKKGARFEAKGKLVEARRDVTLQISSEAESDDDTITVPGGHDLPSVISIAPVKDETPDELPATSKKKLRGPEIKNKKQTFKFESIGWIRTIWRLLSSIFISEASAEILGQSNVKPQLQWEDLPEASLYQIEIAVDRSFSDVVEIQKAYKNFFYWDIHKPGDYFWRVRAIGADGRPGDFSEFAEVFVMVQEKRGVFAREVSPSPTNATSPAVTTASPRVIPVQPVSPQPTPREVEPTPATPVALAQPKIKLHVWPGPPPAPIALANPKIKAATRAAPPYPTATPTVEPEQNLALNPVPTPTATPESQNIVAETMPQAAQPAQPAAPPPMPDPIPPYWTLRATVGVDYTRVDSTDIIEGGQATFLSGASPMLLINGDWSPVNSPWAINSELRIISDTISNDPTSGRALANAQGNRYSLFVGATRYVTSWFDAAVKLGEDERYFFRSASLTNLTAQRTPIPIAALDLRFKVLKLNRFSVTATVEGAYLSSTSANGYSIFAGMGYGASVSASYRLTETSNIGAQAGYNFGSQNDDYTNQTQKDLNLGVFYQYRFGTNSSGVSDGPH